MLKISSNNANKNPNINEQQPFKFQVPSALEMGQNVIAKSMMSRYDIL